MSLFLQFLQFLQFLRSLRPVLAMGGTSSMRTLATFHFILIKVQMPDTPLSDASATLSSIPGSHMASRESSLRCAAIILDRYRPSPEADRCHANICR
nr:hypothetical protein BOH68_13360 [Cobetia sp. MM1IDA2H-1]